MTDHPLANAPASGAVRAARWFWCQPWLLLVVMASLFGANGVAARLATGNMSPLILVLVRWLLVCLALAAILTREQRDELRVLVRHHWRRLAWMGLLGFSGFNAIFYLAAYHTSAINLTLLQSAIPPFTLVGAALVFRTRVRALQIAGMLLTFFGVLIVAAKGDLAELSRFHLGAADAAVIVACACYATYALGLRARPACSALVFFAGLSAAAFAWSIPMAVAEIATGHASWPSLEGWLIALFVAVGPSFAAQVFFMRGVDLIGPGRAGLAANLVPIAGALAAVLVLHEPFTRAHATSLLLALGGVALAEWSVARGLRHERAGT